MSAFLHWPDARLRGPARAVEGLTPEVERIWTRLLGLMYDTPGIVGLAAPQIGEALAVAVVDASDNRREPVRMANPELVWVSEETGTRREGSPNLPGAGAEIRRPSAVRVRFVNETGAVVELPFEGLWAASVQHQIDHLAGRMFFDRLSRLKRERLLAAVAKRARRGG